MQIKIKHSILLLFHLFLFTNIYSQNLKDELLIIGKSEFIIPKAHPFFQNYNNQKITINITLDNIVIGEFNCDSVYLKKHQIDNKIIIFFYELNTDFVDAVNKLGSLPSATYKLNLLKYDSSNTIVSSKNYLAQYKSKQSKLKTIKLSKKKYGYQFNPKKIDTSNIKFIVSIKPYNNRKNANPLIYSLSNTNEVDLSRFKDTQSKRGRIYLAEIQAIYKGFVIGKSEKIKFKAAQHKKDFNIQNDSNLFKHETNIYAENPLLNIIDPVNKEKNILAEEGSIKPSLTRPNFNNIISAKGSLSVQSYYSNISFPTQYQPNKYVRFIANPTISVTSLPFNVNLFLSTENTPINPVNSFTVSFDAETFKHNLEEKEAIKDEFKRKIEALRYQKLLGELNKIENYKDRIENLNKEDSLLLIQSQNHLSKKYSLPTLPDSIKTLPRKEAHLNLPESDSLYNGTKFYGVDSVEYKEDSTYLILKEGIEKRRKEKDSLLRIVNTIQNSVDVLSKLYQNPSSYVTETLENNPLDDSLERNHHTVKENPLKKKKPIINAIKKFNIGLFNPNLSPLTLQGIPVKGFETELEFDKTFYSFAYGKTIRTQNYILNTSTPQEFDRNFRSATVGLGKKNHNNIYLSVLYFNDKKTIISFDSLGDLLYPKENLIYSLGGKINMSEKVNLSSEINYSYYNNNKFSYTDTNQENATYSIINPSFSNGYNLASNNTLEYKPFKNTTIKFNVKYIGPTYTSLGVPFIRNDYHEEEIKIAQSVFKRKLLFDFSYKENRDNISKLKSHKTIMRGTSFSLKSNFSKYPNILFSYIPFSVNSLLTINQNTSNLPSYSNIQRVYNSTDITLVNIYYFFANKKTIYNINAGYTKNKNSNNFSEPFIMESYNGNISISLPNRTTITLLGNRSKFSPASDSLSTFTTANLSFTTGIFKIAKLSIGSEYISNKNRRQALGLKMSLQFSQKKINYIFQTGYRKLDGNWGIPNTFELFFQSSITFNL